LPYLDFGWRQSEVKKVKLAKQKRAWDRTLFILTLVLTLLGLVAVADASAPQALNSFGDKYYFVKQQIVWGGIGLFGLMVAANIHYSFWEKLALPLFIVSLIGLVIVLIPGIGLSALGARRWIIIGPISVQPSEIVKLTLVIYFAKLFAKKKSTLSYFIPLLIVLGLIMLQPDLGTALIVAVTGMVQIFISGIGMFTFIQALLAGGLLTFLLTITSDYRRERLITFFTQTNDPLGKSYHIRQILLALGSGGLLGVGLGASRQKYLFLPEAATDSIFAVIAEEIGFIGAMFILSLFAAFIFHAFKISKNAPNSFAKLLGLGITVWIGGQIFLNVASMVALVPLTGIPLPFFSYGGSALTMVLIGAGILLNISKYAKS